MGRPTTTVMRPAIDPLEICSGQRKEDGHGCDDGRQHQRRTAKPKNTAIGSSVNNLGLTGYRNTGLAMRHCIR